MQSAFKYIVVLLCLVSKFSSAEEAKDCLNLNDNFVTLIDSGKYRFANDTSNKALKNINFNSLKSYQHYIEESHKVIADRNPRATMPCPIVTETYQQLAQQNNWSQTPDVSQLIAPFELTQKNNDKAILLIHGLTDSPYSFHDLAQFFFLQGYTVRTLLLPGHGTAPSDLLEVSYQDWQQATQFAIESTLADFEQVYLGGFSTGGALIFDYLMQQQVADEKIRGLFMWSPASKAKSDQAWLAQYVDYIPFVDWIDLDADIDFAKYESFPYNAAAQVHGLMSRIVGEQAMSERVMHDIPLLVVASEHDQTIDTKQTLALIEQWQKAEGADKNKQTTLIYYGNKSSISLTADINLVVPTCSASALCNEVFDVAHTGTTNAPNNPHYGAHGEYRNCGHYIKEAMRYRACKQNEQIIKGEVTQANLNHELPMQRVTYNPYYQEMLDVMTKFLKVTHYGEELK
jgi:esterase/lipase